MSEPFIGQILQFAGNFAPLGWALCNGQLLSVSQNPALFAILGTTYGGDGRTTTALPNLKGRVPMHPGRGPGLTARRLGQKGGRGFYRYRDEKRTTVDRDVYKLLGVPAEVELPAETIQERLVLTMINDGMSLEEVLAAGPSAEFDEGWGGGFIGPERFVTSVYTSLSNASH